MGAFVAFELARQLRRENRAGTGDLDRLRRPRPSDSRSRSADPHDAGRASCLKNLQRLDGIPQELLDHPELVAAAAADAACGSGDVRDLRVSRRAAARRVPSPLYGGEHDDKVPLEHLTPWKLQTSGEFQLRVFPGNHFFYLKEARTAVTQALREELLRDILRRPSDANGSRSPRHVERVIAGVWSEVLRVPHVGLDDNFFDIGGNSLLMVQAYGKLRRSHEHLAIGARSVSVSDDPLAGGRDWLRSIGAAGRSGTGGHE